MKRLRAHPAIAAKSAAAARESLKRLRADPDFEKKRSEGIRRAARRRKAMSHDPG
jgi:hypothetical protein